ncbi:hypothetical protein MTP99_002607 [Tenebrio molitor]|nr:hypothetical protein MTP99_002607 [Tenebrio molitor]
MGVVFRALHSGVTLHGLVTPVKAPVCSLGCTARPQPPQKETANASVRAAIAPDQTLLIFPQYLGTGITSQSFIKQTYNLCIWLSPPAIPTRCPT